MSVNSKMTAMANSIRALLGLTGTMGLDAMVAHIGTEKTNVDNALAAIVDKGVEVPAGANSGNLAELIASITGGGGGDDILDSIINRNITEFENDRITLLGAYIFYACQQLTRISAPNVNVISYYSCTNCIRLTSVDFPNATGIAQYAFSGCENLQTVVFPKVTRADQNCFAGCKNLHSADFHALTQLGANAFKDSILMYLTLRSNSVCTLASANAFDNTGISWGIGEIYVPANLVDSYKTATNWSNYADYIMAIT